MARHSDNRHMERTLRKYFRCESEDHLIVKCPKPPKENERQQKHVIINENVNHA